MLQVAGANNLPATRPGFVRIQVTAHAMERFVTRYEAYYGVSLTQRQADKEFWNIISEAELELLNPSLEERRQAYPESTDRVEYYINFPWRFVFIDDKLVTCEIIPIREIVVANPIVPFSRARAEFTIEVKEDSKTGTTRLRRYFNRANYAPSPVFDLTLPKLAEVNAVIKSLRAIGISVEYQRSTGEQIGAFLQVVVPQHVAQYDIHQATDENVVFLHIGQDDLFPRGRKLISCYGIAPNTLQMVIDFVLDTSWHNADWFFETLHSLPGLSYFERLRRLQAMGYITINQWDVVPYHPQRKVLMVIAEIQCEGKLIRDSMTGVGGEKVERALYKRVMKRIVKMFLKIE